MRNSLACILYGKAFFSRINTFFYQFRQKTTALAVELHLLPASPGVPSISGVGLGQTRIGSQGALKHSTC
ncbi:MAG: hypothetical protein HY376_01520 [Candidatus Blackburnbacteria bacterium]|nr:hypothetical protein [Candidatus Blackburnbacteria bacterium]